MTPPFDKAEPGVEYREMPGWPGYMIGSDASAWSCKVLGRHIGQRRGEWHRLNVRTHTNGCLVVSVRRGKKVSKTLYLHVLMLEAFVGPRPPGMEGRHVNDNDRTNCSLDNLCWGTPKENAADKFRHGSQPIGEEVVTAKLSEADVQLACELRGQGKTYQEIADALCGRVGMSAIAGIFEGRTWKHTGAELVEAPATWTCPKCGLVCLRTNARFKVHEKQCRATHRPARMAAVDRFPKKSNPLNTARKPWNVWYRVHECPKCGKRVYRLESNFRGKSFVCDGSRTMLDSGRDARRLGLTAAPGSNAADSNEEA